MAILKLNNVPVLTETGGVATLASGVLGAGAASITDNGNAVAITIDSSERVGIGTASLSQKLTVAGSIDLPDVNSYIYGNGHNVLQVDATRTYFYGGTNGVQFRTADNASVLVAIDNSGHITPGADNTNDLGSASERWRNIYTTDLHLANERGNWTVIEEEDYLTIRNNKTDKVYKLVMEEIE
jgi:hypothetical protein